MRQPVRPEWKRPKSEVDPEKQKAYRELPLREALPMASYRLAYLTDPDKQLSALLDHLQEMGIPMGSETWALRAQNRIQFLETMYRETLAMLRDAAGGNPNEVIGRLRDSFGHAREMLAKATPPVQVMCDCCGWPGARAIGNGWAACMDCLPEEPAAPTTPPETAS